MTVSSPREARLRRAAKSCGRVLSKSRVRNTDAAEFGTYMLLDARTGGLVAGHSWARGYGLTLDEVEEELNGA